MTRHLGRAALLALLAVPVHLAAPDAAEAQYFGRQKVQYEDFDWRVMQTDRFKVHFYPAERGPTEDAARMAERWYLRLSNAFQHEFDEKPLIFYADHPDFQQTNVISGMVGEGTGGVTEGLKNRVIMPYTGIYSENDHVLGHELVHVFQYDVAQSPGGGGLMAMSRLPLWLVEGMAEYLSVGRNDTHTAMWLRDATLRGELPTIDQLCCDPRFFPYRYGQALWAYIGGRFGDRAVPELYRFALRFGWDQAVQRVLGLSSDELSADWTEAVRLTYLPVIQGRQRPEDAGRPLLVGEDEGDMHLAPAISPDGRWVAFYSRRDIFNVDLYLADARTGEVVERLTSSSGTAHYDALAFISSAGAWSPDGSKFAFIVFEQGDNRLKILDVASQDVERTITLPVGAIQHPAWSPDGRTLAFSGMEGGVSDLYLLDLPSGDLRQLTDDRYADLQPAWSPDGTRLAFVTDRGPGTDFGTLVFGDMNLASIDVATGALNVFQIFSGVKHINPQFAPDGRSLYFISDREGFSDLYRLDLATETAHQITRLATGVSGITATSPAMTVAADDGTVVFSVFEAGGYNVYALAPERAVGERVTDVVAGPAIAGLLPPVEAAGTGLVASYLDDALEGLPPASVDYAVSDYDPGLQLDFLGPPSVGVGVSEFGTGLTGGVSAYFSDMMGDHQLAAAVQAQGSFKDVGAQVQYFNAARRFNWGAGVAHIPYLTGYSRFTQDETQQLYYSQVLRRIFIDQASLLAQYPLSTTRRFEVTSGFTRYGFDNEERRIPINTLGQQVGDVERRDLPSGDAVNMFRASAAFVGDNSNFGFTSPVAGERFRFEVSPVFGDLSYTGALADYRRYFFFNPLTVAFRGMHYGRYGEDTGLVAEGGIALQTPLFLGYETLVRGYDQYSFDLSECTIVEEDISACPEFDRLVGSRIGVMNLELRIPLLGVQEFGLINFPFVPVEIAPFLDAGVAWTAEDSPTFKLASSSVERIPVFSAGITARANILGYLILETYYAYPFQRPDKGWHFGFNLAPGW